MKRKLTLLLTAFLLLSGMSSWGQLRTEASIDFSEQGYVNAQDMDGVVIDIDENVTIVFNKASGTNNPKYYNSGTAIRVYGGNNFVVSSTGTITSIMLTFSTGDGSNEIITEVGNFESPEWTGSESEVTFTIGGTTGHRRIKAVAVTYDEGGQQQNVATPTFNPPAGLYFESQSVTITCDTVGATIYYTTDGSDPTEDSQQYSIALYIDETTTIKAKAFKSGYTASSIATATYTFPELITMAEAHALENNEYALVEGVVTFIDNRNVYTQDATGGICLFLNSGTVPPDLAIGDLVRAYGKRSSYNGLIELLDIDGNSSAFTIISSGNTLPLTVKTIAEINESGVDALQCTRVKIEGATIGTINTNGNTPLTQGENNINIYKVPTLTNIEEGDVVDVIGVVGYFNIPQIRVALASDIILSGTPVIPDPVLTISVTQLNDFSYDFGSGPSQHKSFTISGVNLVEDITLTAPQNYELSTNLENGFSDTEELSPVNGTLAETTVHVRLKAGLNVGPYSGNLTIVSGDLIHNIALNGMVNEEPSVTMTIAEARALENGQFAQVEGTVIFLDGRNVYIQDETAGIDLYLNSNTVPENLAVGDNVRAYGSKAVFRELVELSGINGSNPDEFSILSSGNELPLAVKTIAEINTDFNASNMLQSTRVKIENAVIDTINPNGTTVISQENNALNIYHIPNVEGLAEGDMITVTGIISCYNTPQLRVANAEDIEFSPHPYLTVAPTTITGFTYVYENGGPSEIQNFEVSGENLTNNVIVSPSENFEISKFAGDLFQPESPISIDIPESGTLSGFQIFVRLKAGLEAGPYNEQLTIASEGVETLYVSVTGTVTESPTPPPTPTGDYVRISNVSVLTAGNQVILASRYNATANAYLAIANTLTSGALSTTAFTSAMNDNDEIIPADIVADEDSYYWTVGVTADGYTFTNANGDVIGYGNSGTNFVINGEKTVWTLNTGLSEATSLVPEYFGFNIINATTANRGFALRMLDGNGMVKAYSTSNMTNGEYNFFLDIFMKGEGGIPPTPDVTPPDFNPVGGTYYQAQDVTISCEIEGANIWYSLVSDPYDWQPYNGEFIPVNESMTIWAYAEKDGYNNSAIASATYIIADAPNLITIAEARALAINEYALVQGVVTFIDGRNVYIQDETAGIDLYLNNNTVPSALALGDMVQAYGKKAVYNGLVELSGINGNDVEQFSILSSGNTLPLAVKTIAEILEGGADALQCIRVKVESATIGTINTSGNTPLTQDESTINIYKLPALTGIEEGDVVDVVAVIGYYNAAQLRVALASDVVLSDTPIITDPYLTVSVSELSGFNYVYGSDGSEIQSFEVGGENLTNNVIVSPSENFEISRFSGDLFQPENPISIDIPESGSLSGFAIYVRLKAGLEIGPYNEQISVTSEGAETLYVSVTGAVTEEPTPPPTPTGDYVRISNVSVLTTGNQVILASRYNATDNAYLAIANTLTSGALSTTAFTSAMNGNDEIIPADIVADEDSYNWTVGVTADGYTFTNANGDVIGYGNSGTNFVMNSERTVWTLNTGVSDTTSLVPEYFGFNIINATTSNRGFALRMLDGNGMVKAYSTSNMTNGEYNFFLDIFMKGESGPCVVAAPTFTPAGGTYYEAQEVTISCYTEDATILYSLISENGPWDNYEGPILVSQNTTIWAYAVKDGCNDSPVVSAEYVIQDNIIVIFNQDWENGWQGWTEYCEMGDSLWHIGSYQGNHYAYANGYNHEPTIDWLISPSFDLDSYNDVVLTFRTAMNYIGPDLDVLFSNDYDGQNPTTATWEPLFYEPSQGSWGWVTSGDISLDGFSGTNCHIGFKYTSTGNDNAAGWEVDDIMLTSGGSGASPTLYTSFNFISGFTYTVGEGPSAFQSYTLIGTSLEGDGFIIITTSHEYFELSSDSITFSSDTLRIPYSNGQLIDTIYVHLAEGLEPGAYEDIITHQGGGATAEVSLAGTVYSEGEPMIQSEFVPLYIQGNNGSNNNRVPVATAVTIMNLIPNTTYRYTNQFIDSNDGPETSGAGNVIYTNENGFYRSTSPGLATEGGYGEFTTNENGEGFAWFINEPTANARFTPGNHVYLRIRINDGNDGTTVANIFTTEDYATVLNYGNEIDEYSGSAFYAKSNEAPMSFAMMFADNSEWRPIYSTSIETTGVDYGSINQYADFYKDLVVGNDGWFGGILPNNNETGVNSIWIYDIDGQFIHLFDTQDGQWAPDANTINPTNGLDEPIFIDLTDDGVEEAVATNVKIWNTDHEFVIENGDDTHYSMTVYNVLGQPMMQQQINAGSTEHIGHNLVKGIYVISLQNNQNKVVVKVIVK